MEVEATSLGRDAFAAPSPEIMSDNSLSPSPWPNTELSTGKNESGDFPGNSLHDAQIMEKKEDAVPAQDGSGRQAQHSQHLASPSVAMEKAERPSQQPSQPPETSSHEQLATDQPVNPAESLSQPQSEPQDVPTSQPEITEQPSLSGQPESEVQPSPTSHVQPQNGIESFDQSKPANPTQTPQPVQQEFLEEQTQAVDNSYPESRVESQGQPFDQAESIDPLSQSQSQLPQTPVKDYADLATAVASLNLPTNALLPGDLMDDLASYEAEEAAPVQDTARDDPMQAFAKLQFPDGDFYVNTYAVELGRDLNAAKHERRIGRMQKMKLKRDVKLEQDAEMDIDEGDAHKNMARSNVSESGGIVGVNIEFDSEEEDNDSKRRKRKQFRSTNSSHSVDPTTLLANPFDLSLDWQPQQDKPWEYECPFIPIHPQAGQSFKNISRKHIRIEYNLQHAYWEMRVNGRNGAFHDDAHLEKGSMVKLHHGSEILVQGLTIIFKLPDNARDEEEEVDPLHDLSDSDSSLSDLGSIPSPDDNDSSEDEPLRLKRPVQKKEPPRRIIKLKLSQKKNFPAVAGKPVKKDKDPDKAKEKEKEKEKEREKEKDKEKEKEKTPKVEKQIAKPDRVEKLDKPEKAARAEKTIIKADKPDNIKQPETSEKTIIAEKVDEPPKVPEERRESIVAPEVPSFVQTTDIKQSVEEGDPLEAILAHNLNHSETPPAVPADLPPGSILAGLAPEEIPQKRKGPGRPPKNGVMSKRDEAIIKRKTKELQKLGKFVPPLAELLALARAEGGTKKDTKSEDVKDGENPRASVEIDPALMAQDLADVTPSAEIKMEGSTQATQPTPDKDASKPKRIVKSPSPQKPESEYTEEELKKPTQTYVVLIHEALSKAPTGVMDLQQIYDAMQKMYPWFKYRSTTHGWQSSVRHNLISSDAFEEAGKIGKGRLWKINPNVSIDKEKKRKAPTPPPERPPQQYPYYPNGQYPYGPPGAPGYGAYARPSPYGTPYGPPTVQNPARPPVPTAQPKPGTYYSPYASTTPGAAHASPYGPPSRPPYAPYPQANGVPQPPRPPGSVYGPPPTQPQGQPVPAQPGQPQQQGQMLPGQPPQGQQPHSQPPQGVLPPGQATQVPNGQAYQPQPNGQAPMPPRQGPLPPNGQPPSQALQGPGPPMPQGQIPPQAQAPTPQSQAAQQSGITSEKMIDNIMDYHKKYLSKFAAGPEQEKHRGIFRKATNRHIHRGVDHGPYESEEEEKLFKAIADIITQSQAETARLSSAQPLPNSARPTPASSPYGAAPPAPMQGAVGQAPPQPAVNSPYARPPGQHQPPPPPPQPTQGHQAPQATMTPPTAAPQQKQGSVPVERELVQALKTAMPSTSGNNQGAASAPSAQPAPTAPRGAQGVVPLPYQQTAAPQYQPQQRPPPGPGQQQAVPQVRTNTATVPTAPAQAPVAARPMFTAPSQPASATPTPAPPAQGSAPGTPRPIAQMQATPSAQASPAPTQASPVPNAAQSSTMAPSHVQATAPPASVVPSPASAVVTGPAPQAPLPPQDTNAAGASLKRPIEIDDDISDPEAKKQKTE